MKTVFTFLVLTFFFTNAQAQEIEATLSGNTSAEGFSVKDSAGTTLFRVNGLGNVGIGMNYAPAAKLSFGNLAGSPALLLYQGAAADDRYGFGVNSAELQTFIPATSHISFNSGGDLQPPGTNEIMRISGTGNVGIGTTNPTERLVVRDESAILHLESTGAVGTITQLLLSTQGNGNASLTKHGTGRLTLASGGAYSMLFLNSGGGSFQFDEGSATRLYIGAGGGIGIGTTSPDQLLSVNGGASKVGGGSWSVFSDRRLKQDISPFQDGLSVLKGIRPVTFRYNGKLGFPTDRTYVGVVAQEIQTVAPYTVDSFKAKLNPEDTAETDILRFDPNALTYISINAIKELSAENQQLRRDLDELKAMVISLVAEKKGVDNKLMGELR